MSRAQLIRVSLINCDPNETSAAGQALEGARRFVVESMRGDEVPTRLAAATPDVVVVELATIAEDELQTLTQVRYAMPQTPLILVSYDLPGDALRKLLKFNMFDWLKKPLDVAEFKNTLATAARSFSDGANSVHAIVSCVGGAGATTLAISMADITTRRIAGKTASVALFDLDFSAGDCGNMLNMANDFDLASVATAPRKIDSEFLHVIQKKHNNGFFLYSFKRPNLNTNPNAYELVLRLLDAVSLEHDITFVDIPYYATEWREDVLAAVNSFTLVTEQNLPALKHTLDQIDQVRRLRGDEVPVQVLINKRSGGLFSNRLSNRKLKELLGDTPFSFVPAENQIIGEALDRGVLPSTISSRGGILKGLTKHLRNLPLKPEKTKT